MRRSLSLLVLAAIATFACRDRHSSSAALLSPNADSLAKHAPDSFRVEFRTGKGLFVVQAIRAWAPLGVDRFYYLATNGYYDGVKFFRVLPDFMAQFGIHGDPAVNSAWEERTIPDDPVKQSNVRGTVTFATGGPNTRSVQLFINKADNRRLDPLGFAPVGRVVEGMHVVDSLYQDYGEGPPRGFGPDQGRMGREGNRYLSREYPRLDSVVTARVLKD